MHAFVFLEAHLSQDAWLLYQGRSRVCADCFVLWWPRAAGLVHLKISTDQFAFIEVKMEYVYTSALWLLGINLKWTDISALSFPVSCFSSFSFHQEKGNSWKLLSTYMQIIRDIQWSFSCTFIFCILGTEARSHCRLKLWQVLLCADEVWFYSVVLQSFSECFYSNVICLGCL